MNKSIACSHFKSRSSEKIAQLSLFFFAWNFFTAPKRYRDFFAEFFAFQFGFSVLI